METAQLTFFFLKITLWITYTLIWTVANVQMKKVSIDDWTPLLILTHRICAISNYSTTARKEEKL
jgi:hypothetical protein